MTGHEVLRRLLKPSEMKVRFALIKNGKYFVTPDSSDEDFKVLFRRLAYAGAGRPVDVNGVPTGSWTPENLTNAIAELDDKGASIETRTVQFWFQDNDKGISSDNIRRLAHIFGCGDPVATSDWMARLATSQENLRARRRRESRASSDTTDPAEFARPSASAPRMQASLARRSEALFSRRGSVLNLPMGIFAGAAALHFAANIIGIDRISYVRGDGVMKQVGFLSAPNWTLLFLVFLPLFFSFAVELLNFWKAHGRSTVLAKTDRPPVGRTWRSKIERSSATYWAVFLICFLFAGLLQWISLRLLPLLHEDIGIDIDWGLVTLVRPDVIGIDEAIAFTGLAYAYMSISFYLMVGGLILLWTIVHDFWEITDGSGIGMRYGRSDDVDAIGMRIMRGIFRCSAAGLLVAICMKIQNRFLPSAAETVLSWLLSDAGLFLSRPAVNGYGFAVDWTSLLVVLPICFVFLYAFVRIGCCGPLLAPSARMMAAFALLGIAYLLIAAFPGFTVLLGIAVTVATYGLFDPSFRGGLRSGLKDGHDAA